MDQLGTGLITVNYGSNLDGSGGGEPLEAAAWVAYVNGKTSNMLAIGKDSKGNDWKTVSYLGDTARKPAPYHRRRPECPANWTSGAIRYPAVVDRQ